MGAETDGDGLLALCKLLLDEERLALIGVLVREPLSRAQLVERLPLRDAVVLRHLHLLCESGIVRAQEIDGEPRYRFDAKAVQAMKKTLFAAAPRAPAQSGEEELLSRVVREGRLQQLPVQPKKQRVVLAWLAELFDTGRAYPEREVNQILEPHAPDPATLRRLLVDFGFLQRERGIYQRAEGETGG